MTRGTRIAVSMLVSAGVGLPVIAAVAPPAWAVGGECYAKRETDSRVGLDAYRARAICYQLDGDTRARAKLVRSGGPDYSSSWFTTLNKYYYTGWYTCYAGCVAIPEMGARY